VLLLVHPAWDTPITGSGWIGVSQAGWTSSSTRPAVAARAALTTVARTLTLMPGELPAELTAELTTDMPTDMPSTLPRRW
jgi:hypothetical protein